MGWELSSAPLDECLGLGEYIRLLVAALGSSDPAALSRLREVVGERSARITLDEESVDVWFEGGEFVVEEAPSREVSGTGGTDTATVLDVMDGYVRPREAILDGRLDATGTVEDVDRMFVAIEILLDAAPRSPALQKVARRFRNDPCRSRAEHPRRDTSAARTYPSRPGPAEVSMLRRLGLLPGGPT
jgi:putative sterol carrier protein